MSRVGATGDQEFASAFRRGFEQGRGFHFQEALLVQILADGHGQLTAQTQVADHFRAAEVQITILQAQFLIDLVGDLRIVNREGQHGSQVQHLQVFGDHLDLTSGDFRVGGAFGALAHLACHANHALTSQAGGLFKEIGRKRRRIKYRLGAAFAVADVDENEPSQVAPGMNPAGQGYRLPDVCRANFVAMMRAFHELISPLIQNGGNDDLIWGEFKPKLPPHMSAHDTRGQLEPLKRLTRDVFLVWVQPAQTKARQGNHRLHGLLWA